MERMLRRCIWVIVACMAPLTFLSAGNVGDGGLRWVENKGQLIDTDGNPRPDVLFKGSVGGADIYLTSKGISFVIVSLDVQEEAFHDMEGEAAEKMRMSNAMKRMERMDMNLVGMSPNFTIRKGEPLASVEHFYLGHCPDGILDVQSYTDITYKDVYPGIDWHISAKDGQLKTEFIVAPGANAGSIRFEFAGLSQKQILPDGSLELQGTTGNVQDDAPVASQGNSKVSCGYQLDGDELAFNLGQYDHNKELVIDPYTRVYATFFGGSGNEWYLGHVAATDLSGNIFMGGHTNSTNFPASAGMFQTTNAGGNDGFVAKFSNAGARIWCTYYGGSSSEGGIAFKAGLCVDPSGNIWFSTVTQSANFPVTAGCFQSTMSGAPDATLVKFSTAGTRLYSTFYGGSGSESPAITRWGANSAPAIASDASGNIFMTGLTQSTNLPVTAGCFQSANAGGMDAFFVKWDNNGARQYATYYGGTANEESAAVGVAVDNGGNVWITGCTASSNFPVTAGCFQSANAGSFDQYLVKWNNSCVRQYATYYGGSSDEGVLCDVDINSTGDVWMGVFVQSNNFPVTGTASQFSSAGGWEFGVVRFNSAGVRQYASYYGSADQEEPWDISVDRITGNVCLTGAAWGASFPTMGPPFQSTSAGSQEGAIVVLSPTGSPIYVTYYGGNGHDEVFCSIFDINQNLWVSGMAANGTFPVTVGAFQTVNGGGTDAFLVKFQPPVILDQSQLDLRVQGVDGQKVGLTWSYDDEQLAEKYVLERDLGGQWVTVHSTVATGQDSYSYVDEVPVQGMVQYRVRLEMKDGSQAYSQMVRVEIAVTEDRLVQLWPNPVHEGEEVQLLWQMKAAGSLDLEVLNLEGKRVLHRVEELASGRSRLDFSTEGMAKGVYLLQLRSMAGKASVKFSVE